MCSYQKVKISPPLNKRLCEGGRGRRKKGAGTTSDALFLRCSTLPQLLLVKLLTIISVSWSIPPPHFSPGRVLHQDCRSQCACAFASPRTALKLKRLPHYTAPFSPLTCCKGQFPQNWLWVWTLWPLPCRESHARAVTQPALLFWPRIAPSPAEPHLINLKRNNHPP